MSDSIKSWMWRLPAVILIAAIMGWVGLILMYLGTPHFPGANDFWTRYVAIASILIWGATSFFLRGKQLSAWVTFGIVSPLIGALLVAPPASFAFVIVKAYIAVPVGLTTGVILFWVVRTGTRHHKPSNSSGGFTA